MPVTTAVCRPGTQKASISLLLTQSAARRPLIVALNLLAALLIGLAVALLLSAEAPRTAAASAKTDAKASLVSMKALKKPRAAPRFRLSDRHIAVGEAIRLSARAKPKGRRALKVIARGPKRYVLRGKTSRAGRYRQKWRPRMPGIYRVRAYTGHNGRARGARGSRRTVTVYRPAHASWFGPGLYGGRTACGQTLTPGFLGVAHKTLPCGTKLRLRHRGRTVTVRVVDRGPFIPGREFDLTYATKEKLHFGDLGTVYSSR